MIYSILFKLELNFSVQLFKFQLRRFLSCCNKELHLNISDTEWWLTTSMRAHLNDKPHIVGCIQILEFVYSRLGQRTRWRRWMLPEYWLHCGACHPWTTVYGCRWFWDLRVQDNDEQESKIIDVEAANGQSKFQMIQWDCYVYIDNYFNQSLTTAWFN